MVERQESWIKKLFPELAPAEVDQAENNLREFLESVLDIFQQINNKEVVEVDQNSTTTTD